MEPTGHEKLKIGTCAWSYDDWRGNFYPEDLAANQLLGFYARVFNAVEVDSTFYAAPQPHVAGHWLDQTPPDFRFACKMPREITHDKKLRDCREPLAAFLAGIAPLHAKLSCVLVQLPPSFSIRKDEIALREFVMELPRDFRFAIEFRNPSWHLPRVIKLLEENNVCWVWTDVTTLEHQSTAAFEFLPQTTDFLYLRLLGDLQKKYAKDGSRIHRYANLMWPRDASLESWSVKINQHLNQCREALVFSGNQFEGSSPLTAKRIADQFGLSISMPSIPPPELVEAENPQLDLL